MKVMLLTTGFILFFEPCFNATLLNPTEKNRAIFKDMLSYQFFCKVVNVLTNSNLASRLAFTDDEIIVPTQLNPMITNDIALPFQRFSPHLLQQRFVLRR